MFLVAAVDGEDDAEGEQGVLRVCDLEGVAAAKCQNFTLDRRHGRAVFRDRIFQAHEIALDLPTQRIQTVAAGKEGKIPRQIVILSFNRQYVGAWDGKRHVLDRGDLPPGGVFDIELFAEGKKLAVRTVDELILLVPDIKMVKRQKFFFQIKGHRALPFLCYLTCRAGKGSGWKSLCIYDILLGLSAQGVFFP